MKDTTLIFVYNEYRSAQAAALVYRMLENGSAHSAARSRTTADIRLWVSSYRKFWEHIGRAVKQHKPKTIWIMGLGAPDSAEGNELLLQYTNKGTAIHWYTEHGNTNAESWREIERENFHYENLSYERAGLLLKLGELFALRNDRWYKALLADARKDDRSRPEARTPAAAYILSQIMRGFRYGDMDAYPRAIAWLAGDGTFSEEQAAEAEEFQQYGQWDYIGRGANVKKLKQLCQVVGSDSGDCRVLISGESGSGKELVARMIWDCSARKHKPFITVNCANFTPELMNSELFGHVKGAFTGATAMRKGLFEEAHGGILFLDEVGELNLELQARLLRVLQTGLITRLGSAKETKVEVRVIAATNRNLLREVQAGRFREDLYYRLAEVTLSTIPFREMEPFDKDTIGLKTWYQISVRRNSWKELTEEDRKLIHQYNWPGNVRQVRNVLTNAFLTQRSVGEVLAEIGAGELISVDGIADRENGARGRGAGILECENGAGDRGTEYRGNGAENGAGDRENGDDWGRENGANIPFMVPPHKTLSMDQMEKEYARYVLQRCGGVKAQACEALGIAYNTLMKYVGD